MKIADHIFKKSHLRHNLKSKVLVPQSKCLVHDYSKRGLNWEVPESMVPFFSNPPIALKLVPN